MNHDTCERKFQSMLLNRNEIVLTIHNKHVSRAEVCDKLLATPKLSITGACLVVISQLFDGHSTLPRFCVE